MPTLNEIPKLIICSRFLYLQGSMIDRSRISLLSPPAIRLRCSITFFHVISILFIKHEIRVYVRKSTNTRDTISIFIITVCDRIAGEEAEGGLNRGASRGQDTSDCSHPFLIHPIGCSPYDLSRGYPIRIISIPSAWDHK